MKRCPWAKSDVMKAYHDQEWGIPQYQDEVLFELLVLETQQAGLSWETVLVKRENYRAAFDGFDAHKIKEYGSRKISELLEDKGIIRNKRKVEAIIKNAEAFLNVQKEWGSFASYLWSFVDGEPIIHHYKNMSDVPVDSEKSRALSKDMKKRGFSFVGPITCYSYMQAAGLIDDHLEDCAYKK